MAATKTPPRSPQSQSDRAAKARSVKAAKDADRATDDTISKLSFISDAKLRDLLLVAAAEYDERRREQA